MGLYTLEWTEENPYGYVNGRHFFTLDRDQGTGKLTVVSTAKGVNVPGTFDTVEQARAAAQKATDKAFP